MKRFAWWNQYGNTPIDECLRRAKDARLDAVIVKAGYAAQRDAFLLSGVPVATEIYAYPDRIDQQVALLRADVAVGARFVVINAEVEWEPLGIDPMEELLTKVRALGKPIYSCTDTRGARTGRPYQLSLASQCAGWMPMIYPKAFQQTVARAFSSALDGKDFRGKPVIPAIQTYDNIGVTAVIDQQIECVGRGLAGYSAYTIGHATDDEWGAVINDALHDRHAPDPTPSQLNPRALNRAGDIFVTCAQHALRGERLPDELHAAARYLIQ